MSQNIFVLKQMNIQHKQHQKILNNLLQKIQTKVFINYYVIIRNKKMGCCLEKNKLITKAKNNFLNSNIQSKFVSNVQCQIKPNFAITSNVQPIITSEKQKKLKKIRTIKKQIYHEQHQIFETYGLLLNEYYFMQITKKHLNGQSFILGNYRLRCFMNPASAFMQLKLFLMTPKKSIVLPLKINSLHQVFVTIIDTNEQSQQVSFKLKTVSEDKNAIFQITMTDKIIKIIAQNILKA